MVKYTAICSFLVLVLILVLLSSYQAQAQNPRERITDSLIALLPSQKEDSNKALLVFRIAVLKMGDAQKDGNWDEAIRWSENFQAISKKVNYRFGLRRSHWMIATCWSQKGDYPEAIKHFTKALQYAYQDSNRLGIVTMSSNLAQTYLKLGNYQEALDNYFVAYKVIAEGKDELQTSPQQMSLSIARVYAKLENFPKALEWGKKALPENPRFFVEGTLPLFLATVQMELNQDEEALKNVRKALDAIPNRFKTFTGSGYNGVLGESYVDYGDAWLKLATLTQGSEQRTSYNEAIKNLEKGLVLMENGSGSKEVVLNGYNMLRIAYEAVGDSKNALKNMNIYLAIRDSLYNKQTYLRLADQRMQFEREKASVEERARIERIKQQLLTDQQLNSERVKLEERISYERKIADEKLKQQATISEEKARFDKILNSQKQEQERLQLEKERMNNLLLVGGIASITIITLCFLLLRQRASKKRALEKTEAIRRMAELELQSLRSQLNPHFMFNSLNSIQELILMEENEMSHSYLARFSKLLRLLLENAEKSFIPLQKELEFLQLYLRLENLRVPDLKYSISISPEVDPTTVKIPNMILQPYIENAIWHGLSHKISNKLLQVRVNREKGMMKYEIQDNGVGRKKAAELKSLFRREHKSLGMELLNKRFKLLNQEFGSEIRVEIKDVGKPNEIEGTLVIIEVPVNISEPLYIQP
jgi:tetratricopeptide (TPR) repeat protein